MTISKHSAPISRRTALKGIGAGIASAALARTANAGISSTTSYTANTDTFRVQLAHRWGNDSLAAVIKNTSPHAVTITNATPVAADYGRFNFSKLTHRGPLTLAAGEEVHVPFEVMGTSVKPYGHFDNRLQKKLNEALVISTKNASSKVTTTLNPRIV